MSVKNPQIIIRANLDSPDIIISKEEPMQDSLSNILLKVSDPASPYHIDSEYILARLVDCMKHAIEQEYNPNHCPLMFDSWSCWNSTPPSSLQFEDCPNFENLGFRADRMAEKECTEEGEWWIHPDTNRLA